MRLSILEAESRSEEWIRKPFEQSPSFNDSWWLGNAKGPLVFCSFTTGACGEVARAQIRLDSQLGVAYPSYIRPRLGSSEIDLLEVRTDLRGQRYGHEVVDLLLAEFPSPCIAHSLDTNSNRFWRSLGWTEHPHPNSSGKPMFVQPG